MPQGRREQRILPVLAVLFCLALAAGCITGLVVQETTTVHLSLLFTDWFGYLGLRGWASLWCRNITASVTVILVAQAARGLRVGNLPAPYFLVGVAITINGLVPGMMVGSLASAAGLSPLPFVLRGLLPHGVIELPVYMWACFLAVQEQPPTVNQPAAYDAALRRLGRFLPVGLPALLVAALIEDRITPLLLAGLLPFN